MKIVSYNVNGLRAALEKGLLDYIAQGEFDIICIQEIKAQADQVDPSLFTSLGYQGVWHSAEKKGYSGVLTLSKIPIKSHELGIGIEPYDNEGRTVITHHENFTLINVYIPSGSSGEDRHEFKMKFLKDFDQWISMYKKKFGPLVVVGDYNIVHKEADIHNPERKDNPSGYRPEERAWMDQWLEKHNLSDAYRLLNPQGTKYSWWSYRAGSRQKDKGWRIDYILVDDQLKSSLISCHMEKDAQHSDHCPVIADFKF